ncbi:hypothetical protein B0H10DRAFT_2217443 [Mycena sp. CBHHK59/15]|nr:hypothetical protein B0H10DRAFT_2217443 [Mycena sp. CBHHK59/15]
MSTTTQILFNSPALHSLKRDQLVKLCKIHSIKANGKNVELVERLKTHAKTLPNDNPLSVAFRSEPEGAPEHQEEEEEGGDGTQDKPWMPRPSSQWELVMDSITEEMEESSSQGTLSSLKSGATLTGEFGTGTGSSKSTTVSSSIRALASSFGLKRSATGSSSSTSTRALTTASSRTSSKLLSSFPLPPTHTDPTDELLMNSTPYDALPPPSLDDLQTDHFTFDTADPAAVAANLNPTLGTAPLPGHTLRPGVPAPVNARLSLGIAPRTPSKKGPTTTIRLVSFGGTATTPPATTMPPPGDTPNLKPFKTTFDLDLGSPSAPAFPESLYPALPASPPADDAERRMRLEANMHADADEDEDEDEDEDIPMPGAFGFDAPMTPPTAMKPFVFGSPSPRPAPFRFTVASPDATTKAKIAAEVLDEMNRRVFGDGGVPPSPQRVIRPLGSAKKGSADASGSAGRFDKAHEQAFGKMQSITDIAEKRQGLKRKSSAASIRVGLVGMSTDEQGRGKRVRVEDAGTNEGKGKPDAEAEQEVEAEKKKLQRERERKKLELNRARRRSSAAAGAARRVSGRVSGVGVLQKPKPGQQKGRGRFGFFAGAAKLVQGVWGKKAAHPAAPAASVAAPVASSSSTSQKSSASAKPNTGLGNMRPPPVPSATNASSNAKGLRAPSMRSVTSTRSSTAAGRARSPLPPSFAPSGTASSKVTASSARTRDSSIAGASSIGTRTSSVAGSMGTRSSSLRVGSLGTRGSLSAANTPSSTIDSAARKPASRPSSRLLAPTASSLAKMNGSPSPGALAAVLERQDTALEAITNTTAPAAGPANDDNATTAPAKGKAKLLPAPTRKPRISRSRVIAKLASQRVASGSSMASTSTAASAATRKSFGGARARSSLGVKVQRGSLGGMKNGPSSASDAKKRARQSEYYAKRKSRGGANAMSVDS